MKRLSLFMLAVVSVMFTSCFSDFKYREKWWTEFSIVNASGQDVGISWNGIEKTHNCHKLILRDGSSVVLYSIVNEDAFITPEELLFSVSGREVILYCPPDSDNGYCIDDLIYDSANWNTVDLDETRGYSVKITSEDINAQ